MAVVRKNLMQSTKCTECGANGQDFLKLCSAVFRRKSMRPHAAISSSQYSWCNPPRTFSHSNPAIVWQLMAMDPGARTRPAVGIRCLVPSSHGVVPDCSGEPTPAFACAQPSPHGSTLANYQKSPHWRISERSGWHIYGTLEEISELLRSTTDAHFDLCSAGITPHSSSKDPKDYSSRQTFSFCTQLSLVLYNQKPVPSASTEAGKRVVTRQRT